MTKGKKTWSAVDLGSCEAKAVPQSLKDDLTAKAQELIERHLKPVHVKPPPRIRNGTTLLTSSPSGKVVISTLWPSMLVPARNAISPFLKSASHAMEYLASGNFNMAYMRHTVSGGRYRDDVQMAEALQAVCNESIFHP